MITFETLEFPLKLAYHQLLLAPALWVQLFPPQAVFLLLSIALLAAPPHPTEFDVGFCNYNFPPDVVDAAGVAGPVFGLNVQNLK